MEVEDSGWSRYIYRVLARFMNVPPINPLFEVPTRQSRMKLRHAWGLVVVIMVTLGMGFPRLVTNRPNPFFTPVNIFFPLIVLMLLRPLKDPKILGMLTVSFYIVGGPHWCLSGNNILQMRMLTVMPVAVFLLGYTGAILAASEYFVMMILDDIFPGFVGTDPPTEVMAEYAKHCVVIQMLIIVAFQSVNVNLERNYEFAVNYRCDFRNRMSHELRTPLFGIVAISDFLKRVKKRSEIQSLLKMLDNCTHSMINLISGMIDISKLQSLGKIEIELVPVSLLELLEITISIVTPLAMAKKLQIELVIESATAPPATIITDASRLRQVLVTILSNAIRFTQQGTIELNVSCPTPEFIRFTVRDPGIGMDSDTMSKLFTTPSLSRTQLPSLKTGLALSKYIIATLGGTLTATSLGPMKGSSFEITVPVCSTSMSPPGHPPPTMLPKQVADVAKREERIINTMILLRNYVEPGSKILVAEDNALSQMLIVKMLAHLDLKCDIVPNGVEALHKIFPNVKTRGRKISCDDIYSLLIVDLEMPIMNGIACIEELQNRGCKLPVILMSAHPLAEQQKLVQESKAKVKFFLTKPFDTAALCHALTTVLIGPSSA